MLEDRQSKFSIYSLGIVVEDKARGSDEIKVYPVEELPMVDGKVTDYQPKYKSSAPDAKGIVRNSTLDGTAVMIAKWLPFGHSNRITSPDVIKNETVVIFKYADTGEYYWTTIFREPQIRRLETVCYMFGDLQAPLKGWDKNSSYWFEVSTHDKHIHLHTANTDGEPFVYDIKIDTEKGFIHIKDDVGNFINFDSRINQITAHANEEVLLEAPLIRFRCNEFVRESHGDSSGRGSNGHEVGFSDT